jgi:hypothetical protein
MFVFDLGLAYGYIQSDLMDQGTYQGLGSVAYKVSTNATILNTVTEIVRSSAVAELAGITLEAELLTLDNGDAITPAMIRSTLTVTTTTFDGPSSLLYLAIGALLGLMVGGAVGV